MKKLCFYALTALLVVLYTGCTETSQDNLSKDSFSEAKNEVQGQELRVVNVLLTTGECGYSSSTVAYLLLENDEVIVYDDNAIAPFTKEQARIIMRFQMGDTVMVASHK